ncbi:MAG: hypothetical protein AAFZ18_03645 [Myxococcota bacterium]
MVSCTCLVQAERVSAEVEDALRSALQAFSQRAFGAPSELLWIVVPKGSGFTAAQPSRTSVVSMRAPTKLQQSVREALLRELCALWTGATGCSQDEVVAVIRDPRED